MRGLLRLLGIKSVMIRDPKGSLVKVRDIHVFGTFQAPLAYAYTSSFYEARRLTITPPCPDHDYYIFAP